MAAKKKASSKGASKKASKKAAPKKKSAARPREIALMSTEERRSKLKPRDNYDDLVEEIVRAMKNHPRVRVDGLKPSRLERLLRDAKKASDKEDAIRDQLTRKLAPVTDRRIHAEDALWRAVLDVNAGVKPYARKDGSIADAFSFLTAALAGTRSEPTDPGGGPPS